MFPPTAAEKRRAQLQARIRKHIIVDPVTGCWRWTGKKTNASRGRSGSQYPLITVRVPGYKTPRNLVASRVSLEVFTRPPLPGEEAAHDPERCPYTDCVNYDHLRWATRSENEADKRHPQRLRLREVPSPLHRLFADEAGEVICPF